MSEMPPSPALFFDTITAHQRTAALKGAIELDLFSAIGDSPATASAIASRCKASERGIRVLCDYLTVIGFLIKNGNTYSLTKDTAAFLTRQSPAYMGDTLDFLLSPTLTESFRDIAGTVRKGGTILEREGTVTPDHPVWVKFARSMAGLMRLPAELSAEAVPLNTDRPIRILDIAAGHGMYGIAFAMKYPNANIVALDWPNVLEVARQNAQAAGVADRFSTIPGDAFEVDWAGKYDAVLLPNFLHHFSEEVCTRFIRKVRNALVPGGLAATIEFIPNDDRVSPPASATFSFTMLTSTPEGDAYTFSELQRMFQNAGFSRSEFKPLPPSMQQLVISYA